MNNHKTAAIALGVLLIGIGLGVNKWSIAFLLSSDGQIESLAFTLAIALFQVLAIGSGLFLVLKKPDIQFNPVNLFLAVFSALFALFLGEVGAWVWLNHFAEADQVRQYRLVNEIDKQDLQWSPHHYLNYYPTPNFRRGFTSHNSLGYRGPEFSLQKPQGVYRIAVLGGSSTYTLSVKDNEKIFTAQMQTILREKLNYKNVEVINAGVVGYNSWESLINLEFRVLDLNPDLIVIYQGTNDVHARLVRANAYTGDGSGRRKQWTAAKVPFIAQYSVLSRIIGEKLGFNSYRSADLGVFVDAPTYLGAYTLNPDPSVDLVELLESNPPVYFKRNLTNMVAIAKTQGIEIVLSTWAHSPFFEDYAATAHYQKGFQENNEVVRQVAAEQKVPFFDFAKAMSPDKKYWAEGRHVNEAGALLKANLFADFIHHSALITTRKN